MSAVAGLAGTPAAQRQPDSVAARTVPVGLRIGALAAAVVTRRVVVVIS